MVPLLETRAALDGVIATTLEAAVPEAAISMAIIITANLAA